MLSILCEHLPMVPNGRQGLEGSKAPSIELWSSGTVFLGVVELLGQAGAREVIIQDSPHSHVPPSSVKSSE